MILIILFIILNYIPVHRTYKLSVLYGLICPRTPMGGVLMWSGTSVWNKTTILLNYLIWFYC